ncbi:three-Cys-motif partner protein TcmP [Alicyclobacillus kakegawensis]|uniref:three-Cys-motif partner protein TcmP n=1 Tax=Alicyclobacillus kakegawensis TaxID=392012 RepID=UPI0009F8D88E
MEPHTQAKHIILRNYLRAWFPIMGFTNRRVLFIDGHAGPGIYTDGEDGSPVIAIREAVNYLDACVKHGWNPPEIVCLFMEEDRARYDSLVDRLNNMKILCRINVSATNSTFEEPTKVILEVTETTGLNWLRPSSL